MTTFQDQPPQSRRAVRQSERDGATGAQVASGDVPVTPPQPSFVQQPTASQPAPQPAVPGQPAAQQPGQSHAAPPVSGRRSRAAAPSGLVDMPTSPPYPGAEPLNYVTQGAQGAQQPSQPATPAQSTGEQPAFRVRDFSPEAGRRPVAPTPGARVPDAAPLDYRTQAGPAVAPRVSATPVEPAPVEPAPVEPAPADSAPAAAAPAGAPNPPVSLSPTGTPITASGTPLVEQGVAATGSALAVTGTPEVAMTRRELRAQQAERDAAAARASGTFAVPPLVEPAAPTSTLSTAMAEFEALTRAAQGVAAPLPAAEPTEVPAASESEASADEQLERAREAATAAQAAAQAEAATRAREEAKQQSELIAQRAFEAEQNNRARLAEAAQAAQQQEAAAQAAAEQEAAQAAEQAAAEVDAQTSLDALLDPAQPIAAEPAPSYFNFAAPTPAQPTPAESAPAEPAPADQLQAGPPTPADPLAAILGSGFPPVAVPTAAEPAAPVAPILDPLNPAFIAPDLHQTGSHATSTGHWSRQAELDDETQPHENTLSRDVGGGNVATTTSALVLPAIPAPADFGTIINGTGEILVTGSIELPRSLGATGGDQRRYDDPDVDNLFDAFDNEIISTDSAPVRAIRAVSTHTSTHGVIANNKPKNGNRMLVILLASTVTLAVAVVALLAVAANLFP